MDKTFCQTKHTFFIVKKDIIVSCFALLFLLCNYNLSAQVYLYRSEIIKLYGNSYESGIDKNGRNYIMYIKDYYNSQNQKHKRFDIFYFSKKDGLEGCIIYRILEHPSEINSWVKIFKEKYVSVGKMKWKDYQKNIVWKVEIKDNFCDVNSYFDDEL